MLKQLPPTAKAASTLGNSAKEPHTMSSKPHDDFTLFDSFAMMDESRPK